MSFFHDASPFWRYFRDTLAVPFLAAPGPLTVLAHGLARYLDTVRQDILWVRSQFAPPKADDAHIPLHGASRGVPRTRFDTDARYRTRVERAAAWHRLGGKVRGLPEITAEYGYADSVIHNCREDNPALWAHFDLEMLYPPLDFAQADVDAAFALANQHKPARSVIGKIRFARQSRVPLCLGAALQRGVIIDHYARAREAALPGPVPLVRGAALHGIKTIEHFIRMQ